jgi:type II secretory pathway component GspD/PulD (secretin)
MVFSLFGKSTKAIQPVVQNEKISLSFQNMEVAQVLQLLAKESGLNIILAENVRGRISGHFKNILPETALVNIVQSANCSYAKDGDLYRVFKSAAATPKSNNVREFRLSYADGEAVEKELIKMIPSLEGKIILTKENNTLLISARHPQLGLARDIIQSLDVPPLQVMVEAKIFEVSAEESSKIGSKLIGTQHNDADTTTFETFNLEPSDRAIYVRSVDSDIQAYVSALESKTDFNMLSAPKVIVANKREAVLETTEEVAYQDETVSYTTSGEVISKKLIFKNVGTKLKLIPHINEKGFISIDLYPEISSAVVDADTNYPLTHMTKAHTQVVVKDGETFLIGGLLRDKKEKIVKKVPFLGDIPWLGFFFRRTEEENVKKDIMIMITPTIIDPFKPQAK